MNVENKDLSGYGNNVSATDVCTVKCQDNLL